MSAISAHIHGKGKPVLLLHGFCETHHIWNDLQLKLGQHHCIINIDLPGFGDSQRPDGSFSLTDVADLIYDWMQQSGYEVFDVIGHSLGGYIALEMAKKYPKTISGICLFHSSIFPDTAEKKIMRDKTAEFIQNQGLDVYIDSFFQNLYYPPNLSKPVHQQELQTMQERAKLHQSNLVVDYLMAMKNRSDSSEWAKNYDGRLWLIAGVEDMAVPIASSREQSMLNQQINYTELVHVAHMGMMETPEKSYELLSKFMEE